MNGYLMRLATRGGETSAAQSMQPSVRTSSPVAEHDQRIGTMGFEGFEPGEASVAEVGSEVGAELGDILQPPMLPSVRTAGETGIATVQRKMTNSPVGMTGSAASTARREAIATNQRKLVSPPVGMTGSAASTARHEAIATNTPVQARVQSRSSGASVQDLGDAHNVSVSLAGPPIVSPASSTDGIRPEALGMGDSQPVSTSRRFAPDAVHTRSIRQTRQVDSTRLEPSPRVLAEHFKAPPERAGEPHADINEGPSVVIGRINVEVVPPPVAPPSTAAPRPGPVTAASVSVIGPLSAGVPFHRHLSLRHR